MEQIRKLKMNTSVSLINRVIRIISGLILPRLILSNYGSEANGLVSSISQFLSIITFLDMGVGVVVRSALYRPLANRDNDKISVVLIEAKKYFRKIAYFLVIYIVILIVLYPLLVDSTYGYLSTVLLFVALSISYFGQYYFGIVNELLLTADQQDYIQLSSEIVVVILNIILSIVLINQGASIEIVKLAAGLVYLFRPIFLKFYVSNKYEIDYTLKVNEDPLPQRWNGMAQHIAYSINNSTDILVLTFLSTLEKISVYSVFNMIISSINMLVSSLTAGLESFFGNLYVKDEIKKLNDYFNKIEWFVHKVVIYLYGMTAVLINSFVMLYTLGVEDVSYNEPLFSFILVCSASLYSIRIPYNALILSASHFKETQMSSYIEAGLNIVISLSLVPYFGLSGVAFGTFVAMGYRILYLILYLSKNIVYRSLSFFIRHLFVDCLSFGGIMGVGTILMNIYKVETLYDWIITAIILGAISLALMLIINILFFKDITVTTLKNFSKKK